MRYLLLILILAVSCMKTEILNAPEIKQTDTVILYKSSPPKDTIYKDTIRVPIEFNPIVEDWNDSTNCKI